MHWIQVHSPAMDTLLLSSLVAAILFIMLRVCNPILSCAAHTTGSAPGQMIQPNQQPLLSSSECIDAQARFRGKAV